jgi:Bacterial Ig domain
MPLDVSGAQLLGGAALGGAVVVVIQPTTHGQLSVSPDGSFTYVPAAGFLGTDSFWVATSAASRQSEAVEVVIRVLPIAASPSSAIQSAAPLPSPSGDAFLVGSTSRGGSSGSGVSFGTLGPLDFAFEWLIPGFVMTLPGLLVVLVVLAQALVGSAWLPLVRRDLGDFGLRRRR